MDFPRDLKPFCPSCETELRDWPYMWPDPHCVHCGARLPYLAREVLREVLHKYNISPLSVEMFFRNLDTNQAEHRYHNQGKQPSDNPAPTICHNSDKP